MCVIGSARLQRTSGSHLLSRLKDRPSEAFSDLDELVLLEVHCQTRPRGNTETKIARVVAGENLTDLHIHCVRVDTMMRKESLFHELPRLFDGELTSERGKKQMPPTRTNLLCDDNLHFDLLLPVRSEK